MPPTPKKYNENFFVSPVKFTSASALHPEGVSRKPQAMENDD